MASAARKLWIRFLAWISGLILAGGLFTLVGISLLVDFVNRLVHWGAPTDEEVSRRQAEDASSWWARLLAKAEGGNPSAAALLVGPAPAEELARLVKEEPAIVLDGECGNNWRAHSWEAQRGERGRAEQGGRGEEKKRSGTAAQRHARRRRRRRLSLPLSLSLCEEGPSRVRR
jgi:hypothetical protein